MRKWIISIYIFSIFGIIMSLTAYDKNFEKQPIEQSDYQIISLSDVTKTVVKATEGEILPFQFFLIGEFFYAEESNPRNLKILKECYIKNEGGNLFFSNDLKEWKDFQNFFNKEIVMRIDLVDGKPEITAGLLLN